MTLAANMNDFIDKTHQEPHVLIIEHSMDTPPECSSVSSEDTVTPLSFRRATKNMSKIESASSTRPFMDAWLERSTRRATEIQNEAKARKKISIKINVPGTTPCYSFTEHQLYHICVFYRLWLTHRLLDFQTPDQAIKWLDPTYDGSVHMPDENIIAIAASKSAERPEHAELCRKALKIIGYARNSEQLTAWSSASADPKSVRETAISDALEFFRITDRNNFDMEVLSLMIDDWGGDAPRHYNVLLEMRKEQESIIGPAAYEKPVGLENMGNTCYLNCLLQFLYTVKPVRDLILDFDQHKLDTTSPSFRPKQVDFVPVPRTETEQSQQFVTELRDLFRDMSTNPHSAVRPTWDLAKFALKRSAMPTLARRSTLGGDMASLKSPIGTQAPPLPESSIVGSSPVRRGTSASASEITLIDSVEPTPTTESDSEMKMDDLVEKDARVALDSPEQLPKAMEGDDESVPLLSSPSKETSPDKPPPVPPRPALTIGPLTKQEAAGSGSKEESSKREAEEAAQQQDVEEAMSNVLWKVQCAVEDTITTASGSTTNVVNQ